MTASTITNPVTDIAAFVAKSRAAQGFAPTITDVATLAKIASIVAHRQVSP